MSQRGDREYQVSDDPTSGVQSCLAPCLISYNLHPPNQVSDRWPRQWAWELSGPCTLPSPPKLGVLSCLISVRGFRQLAHWNSYCCCLMSPETCPSLSPHLPTPGDPAGGPGLVPIQVDG